MEDIIFFTVFSFGGIFFLMIAYRLAEIKEKLDKLESQLNANHEIREKQLES